MHRPHPRATALPSHTLAFRDRAGLLLSFYMGLSIATLCLSILTANTFAIGGSLCGAIAGATHRFPGCRAGADLSMCVQRLYALSAVAATLCGIVALVSTLISFGLSAS